MNRIPRLLLLLLLLLAGLCLGTLRVGAQGQNGPIPSLTEAYVIRSWESEREAHYPAVMSIAQSPDGFLWIGSYSDLVRFDGRRFTLFVPQWVDPGLGGSIHSLCPQAPDSLWVGTDNGILRMGRTGSKVYGSGLGVAKGPVHSLVQDGSGQMLAVLGNSLVHLEAERWVEDVLGPELSGSPWRLLVDGAGVAHAWSEAGVLTRSDGVWKRVIEPTAGPRFRGAGRAFQSGIWIADERKVSLWRDGQWVESRERPAGFRGDHVQLYEDEAGLVWMGCYTQGLVVVGRDGPRWAATSRDGLPNISITQLVPDREGHLWVGSNGGGVVQVQRRSFHVYSAAAGLDQVVVNSMASLPDGSLLVGTHGGGAQVFKDGKFGPPLVLDDKSVRKWVQAVVADGAGGAWIGTVGDGLFRWSEGKVLEHVPPGRFGSDNVDALFLDSGKRLWVGGSGSTALIEGGVVRVLGPDDGLPEKRHRCMGVEQTPDGVMWLLLDEVGLFRRPVGGKFEPVKLPMVPLGAPVTRLYVDTQGTLWLGCSYGPLGRWRDGAVRWMTPDDGVPVDGVFSMMDDGAGGLWVGGPDAIGRITLASVQELEQGRLGRLERWRFGKPDGVPVPNGREFAYPNVMRDAAGRVWFATLDGLAEADPKRMRGHRTNGVPIFDSIGLVTGEEQVIWGSTAGLLRLQAGTRDVRIRYTAAQLGDPEQTEFEYRLGTGEWLPGPEDRQIQIVDLKPGEHVVALRSRMALDPDWSLPVELHFEIDWSWWELPGFRWAVSMLSLGAAGVGMWWWLDLRFRRRQEQAAREERMRLMSQERDAAAAANQAKTEFIAMISHELRTPLHGLLGYTELLKDTPLSSLQGDYVQRSRQSAESLLRVINEVLDYSRLETGRLDLEVSDFQLSTPLAECMELMSNTAAKRGLEFLCLLDPRLTRKVRGDGQRIHQVLVNLVGNALKFTHEGHVWVTVTPAPEHPGQVLFRVEDSGIGIAEADLPRLFQRFSQADSSHTRRYEGTGLGLAISKGIVERMGGQIGCESAPGKGSRFWFRLPLPAADESSADDRKARVSWVSPEIAMIGLGDMACEVVVSWMGAARERAMRFADVASTESWLRQPGVGVEGGVTVFLSQALVHGDPRFAVRSLRAASRKALIRIVVLVPASMHRPGPGAHDWGCDFIWKEPLVSAPMPLAEWVGREVAPVPPPVTRVVGASAEAVRPPSTARLPAAGLSHPPGTEPSSTPAVGRVLLVEDHPVNQAYARDALVSMGCRVDLANNGREAVEMFRAREYELVLMDCQMPELDGWEATRQIRAMEGAGKRVYIAALTAGAYEGDRERCLEAGMDDFLAKPFRIQDLKRLLERRSRS
jgi:signal transduction histidine kinase/CheY-like chemotaxis protein/ligand-binding sensor domain-containing protein